MENRIFSLINAEIIDIVKLNALLNEMNTVDIAETFDLLQKEKKIQLFRLLPKVIAADVFNCMDADGRQVIIEALTDSEVGDIINKLFADDAADLIEEMPANLVNRLLKNAHHEKREIINRLLQYPDNSAGSIMTTEYVVLSENATVREAFDEIRATGVNKETIYTCYVIRRDHLLIGVVSVKKLILSKSYERIGDIMDTGVLFVKTTDDNEVIAKQFQKYDLLAMPVVDKEQRLVGIITVDDIVDVIVEENTEDIEKMNALVPSDEPYLNTGVFKHAKNRFLWLLFLMLSAILTGLVITNFEEGLAVMPILMAFIPMLMDTGGNAGSQSSALIIRGMAVGEIGQKDIIRIIWKEIRVALLCGLGLGLVNFIRVYFMNGHNLMLCVTITLSLCCTLVIAKTIGCVLPIIAKLIKIDPAIMAAPLITTIADVSSLIVYFSIAKVLFKL